MTGGKTKPSFKENARTFFKKIHHSRKYWHFMTERRQTKSHKQTSNQKLNQWLKTYKMNFIYYKTNKQKVLNFVLTLDRSWRAKNALKLLSKYLKHRICEIKQYLNHILMIINQNILAMLTIFFNFQKLLWKTLHQANFHCCYYWIS